MSQFKLSQVLKAHKDDVKALSAPFNDTLVSVSRDGTVLKWSEAQGTWDSSINFSAAVFVNSLTFDPVDDLVISGSQDGLINITDLEPTDLDAKFVLIGHKSNVCSLDYKDNLIISGSWDTTAKVWENNQLKYTLTGHNAAVWDVKVISPDRFLTASADRTIRLWDKDKEVKTFVGHEDVIRSIALLQDGTGFVSASNDGTLRITKFTGETIQVLTGHESFVYTVKILSNGDIVSAGEDRTVRVWRNGTAVQVITVPAISTWSVAVFPNDDIAVGGSDNQIRIFSKDPSRFASESELEAFHKEVESIAISSKEFDQSKSLTPDALTKPGTKEGQVIVVKSDVGINEAYMWSANEWTKVGEVVSGPSNEKKVEYDNKKWDYVFDVDVEDGKPPLKLPYNITENPYVAAERFLAKNDLPSSYKEEVVQFISKNTEGVNIGQTVENPYYDSKPKILPNLQYLSFLNDNQEAIFKGIEKINSTEQRITNEDINLVKEYSKTKNVEKLAEFAISIIEDWDNKLPGFDILRLVIPYLKQPTEKLGDILKIGLDKTKPTIYFMTFRLLSNIFLNPNWGEAIVTDSPITTKIINLIEIDDEKLKDKVLDNVSNAIATLLLNYSIYAHKYQSRDLAQKIYEKLSEIGSSLVRSNSEAAYRTSTAYGKLILLNEGYKDDTFQEFKAIVLSKYSETRFTDLFDEIQ